METNEFDCKDCLYQGTDICKFCIVRHSPSGKMSRPSHFVTMGKLVFEVPLGLKPKYIHDEQRAKDISNAIIRYIKNSRPIPIEWVNEYNDLRTQDKQVGNKK